MKIGIHQHVFTPKLEKRNLDYLNLVSEIGFNSVDINVRILGLGLAKAIKERANKLKLTLKGGGSLPLDKNILSEDKSVRENVIKYMKHLVRLVYELGSDFYGGIIYAPCGFIKGRPPIKQEFEYAIEGLSEVAKYAKGYGVNIGIEPANRYETYMINTIKDTLSLIRDIGEKNVGILYDTFHMNIEEKSFYDSILDAKSKIIHFHVNENDRGIPGTGHILWDEVFRGIKDINYNKVVTIESFVDSSVDISKAACIWRKLAPDWKTLAQDGFNFISLMAKKYDLTLN